MNTFMKEIVAFPMSDFSEKSRIFLQKILYYIQLSKKEFPVKMAGEILNMTKDDFPRNPYYSAIPEDIRNILESCSHKLGKKYIFQINKRTFTTYFIIPMSSISQDIEKKIYTSMDKNIRKVYEWLYVASKFTSDTKCSPSIDIYLYMTDHKKEMPLISREHILGETHINTGFTMACPIKKNEICVYRQEEWYKVLMHESFHSLGLDFALMDESVAKDAIYKIFPLETKVDLYETYNEVWAEFLNLIFLKYRPIYKDITTIELRKSAWNSFLTDLREPLNIEAAFSRLQACKVLHYYGINYRQLYERSSSAQQIRRHKYKEQSNAFAYYILKNICLHFLPDFVDWCIENNKGSLNFKKSQSNVLRFVNFIKEKYGDSDFVRSMDSVEEWIDKNKSTHRNGTLLKTLRFTVYG